MSASIQRSVCHSKYHVHRAPPLAVAVTVAEPSERSLNDPDSTAIGASVWKPAIADAGIDCPLGIATTSETRAGLPLVNAPDIASACATVNTGCERAALEPEDAVEFATALARAGDAVGARWWCRPTTKTSAHTAPTARMTATGHQRRIRSPKRWPLHLPAILESRASDVELGA